MGYARQCKLSLDVSVKPRYEKSPERRLLPCRPVMRNFSPARQTEMAEKILIVEDEVIIRKNFSHVLRAEGYEVEEATSGIQALELLEYQQFDLVITDVIMPRLGGLELAARVHARAPQTPIILLTAYPLSESKTAALPEVVEILMKPIDLDVLVSTVKRLLQRSA
jgi:CheY-like chemotaxis protein